jgi:muramoyltetrapeptide carboxypeptidase
MNRTVAFFPPLPPGSVFGIVAPAGPALPERVAAVEALYAAMGYRARVFPGCHERSGHGLPYLAGDDARRLADLHAALADDAVAALHCLRGGYGAMRLLPHVDTALLRAKPKLLVGYSDITALHALWCREGLPSLHAPMPASDLLLEGREADRDALFALLRGGHEAGSTMAPPLLAAAPTLEVSGTAEGRVIGGNLSLVAALLGTPWAWPCDGAILFLEDLNEEDYRVDRLLTQLRIAGVFDRVGGVVLGSFTEMADPSGLLAERIAAVCRAAGKPLLAGWPTGHGTPNRPLPMGLRARLVVPAPGDGGAPRLEWLEGLLQAPRQSTG